ncbi:MAG: 2-succinyl-5-enolpyruvyl-6-hydroxy-3-cyclohexene-1-carboxylate synthase, partial [Actinomycetales bacterium]
MEPSIAQARVMVDELVRCGVQDVVLAPGSRSAPLALELSAAERAGRIQLHVRIDERTAGSLPRTSRSAAWGSGAATAGSSADSTSR